jgi:GT2 family glycosyltransferase
VVIVSHNSAHLIGNCLQSLFRDCAGSSVEVFVVDTASSDDSVSMVKRRFPQIQMIAIEENIGFPAANNVAIARCRGRHVLLLNPDTIVQDGGISGLLDYLDTHFEAGAAGPTLRLGDGRIQPECARNLPRLGNLLQWLLLIDKLEWRIRFRGGVRRTTKHPPRGTVCDRLNLLSWDRSTTCEVESISGACMMIRREVIEQIGPMDEAIPFYLDDIDYCRRIRDAGRAIYYVQGPTVTHLWQQSSSLLRLAGDFYAMACHAIWLYLRKHEGRAAAATFAAMVYLTSLLRCAVAAPGFLLPGETPRKYFQYQWRMARGLSRWAVQFNKVPPQLGFAVISKATIPPVPGQTPKGNS